MRRPLVMRMVVFCLAVLVVAGVFIYFNRPLLRAKVPMGAERDSASVPANKRIESEAAKSKSNATSGTASRPLDVPRGNAASSREVSSDANAVDGGIRSRVSRQSETRTGRPVSLVGTWINPSLPSSLRIKGDLWEESPNNGGPSQAGIWQRFPDGSVVLIAPQKNTFLVVRLSDNVLACQEKQKDQALVADGYVRFKDDYDWQGTRAKGIPPNDGHRRQIVGQWTHPNIDIVYEGKQNGDWIKHRKKGGIESKGTWKPLDDGSFVVELQNKWKERVWGIEGALMAILPLDPNGTMQGDGVLVVKKDANEKH